MPLCVSVDKIVASRALSILRRIKALRGDLRVTRQGPRVLLPVDESKLEEIEEALRGLEFAVVDCHPPLVSRTAPPTIPAYDLIGDVAIVRARVLESLGEYEVVSALTSIHPRLKSIYVVEETTGEYRVPSLRLLWGENRGYAEAREYGLVFRVPLGRAYYNPRLAEEHHRVAESVEDGEVVLDMFSGIGGFALHIASLRDAFVVANDKNPEAYKHIIVNVRLNYKKLKGVVYPLNYDAADLVNALEREVFDRVIANLPTRSLDFAPFYGRLLRSGGVLHLYILSHDIMTTYDVISEKLAGFSIEGHRLVLEHSPRAGVFRVDLVKR
ncbi:methyltransferase [Thermogladius calderae 1633]|uniref:Methyltransferase n=1 Tax=Thermogladius calderae (strain DSM 22663 / VKM B-2946 / 1633) TaxID=1184251 RepID=I3TE04_THEC1|nr:methyltransferase [Thermogladius calderae]AFK50992.1 methyltransferase [Thermogladius calderae 1633]